MRYSTRDMARLLLLAVSAAAVANASQQVDRREAVAARDVVDKRQILTLSVGVPPETTSTGRSVPPNSEPTTTPTSSTRESSTRPTSTSPSATSSSPAPSSSSPPRASSTSAAPTPETSTIIVTATRDDGSPTTYATQTTSIPTTQPGGSGGGMPENTKTTVIGVVVGIGGAIVLVVLGFLAWRIWGRNRQSEESDELMGYGTGSGVGSAGYGVEKTSEAGGSSQGRTPFQSTLESYHAPTHVNPSSNF